MDVGCKEGVNMRRAKRPTHKPKRWKRTLKYSNHHHHHCPSKRLYLQDGGEERDVVVVTGTRGDSGVQLIHHLVAHVLEVPVKLDVTLVL